MKVIAIDFDGVLNDENDKPIKGNIEKVNKLFEERYNVVIIHTARSRSMYQKTFDLLRRHGVKFHALVMEKLRADIYIDDKNREL